jgi:hypothetical protein
MIHCLTTERHALEGLFLVATLAAAACVVAFATGCGASGEAAGGKAGKAATPSARKTAKSPAPRRRPRPEEEPPMVRPPAGPNLAPMSVVTIEVAPAADTARKLLAMTKTSPPEGASTAKSARELLSILLGVFSVEALGDTIDIKRKLVGAVVTPATSLSFAELFGMVRSGGSKVLDRLAPKIVARVPITGDGSALLAELQKKAKSSSSTAWGGYVFKLGSTDVWVHIKGRWAVLALREDHVGPAWKLFDRRRSKLGETEALRIDVDLASLHSFFRVVSSLATMVQNNPKYGKLARIAVFALGVLRETNGGSIKLSFDPGSGIALRVKAKRFQGAMLSWLRSLKKPSGELAHALPRRGFLTALYWVPSTERLWWVAVAQAAFDVWVSSKSSIAANIRTKMTESLKSTLDGFARSFGKQAALGLSFDKASRLRLTYVSALADRKRFFETAKKLTASVRKSTVALSKASRSDSVSRKGDKASRKPRVRWKASRRTVRVRGKRVELVRLTWARPIRARRENAEEKPTSELLFGNRLHLALTAVGDKAVVHLGSRWKKAVSRTIARLQAGGSKRASVARLAKEVTEATAGETFSAMALSPKMLLTGFLRIYLRGTTSKRGAREAKQLLAKLPSAQGLEPTVYYSGTREGTSYEMKITIPSSHVASVAGLFRSLDEKKSPPSK